MEYVVPVINTKFGKPKKPKKMPEKKIKNETKLPRKDCPKGHTVCSCR